jgi:hypothetical protein
MIVVEVDRRRNVEVHRRVAESAAAALASALAA